jgi:hypothetical protein
MRPIKKSPAAKRAVNGTVMNQLAKIPRST